VEELLRDTPRAPAEAIRFKEIVEKAQPWGLVALREILGTVVGEAVKRLGAGWNWSFSAGTSGLEPSWINHIRAELVFGKLELCGIRPSCRGPVWKRRVG
jgi:hypothetical protein